jgi:hypothetical protein
MMLLLLTMMVIIVQVWDGEMFAVLWTLDHGAQHVLPFRSAEGKYHLLVTMLERRGLQVRACLGWYVALGFFTVVIPLCFCYWGRGTEHVR